MAAADFIVVGAGSAGCVLAAELARRQAGSVLLLEAGPSDAHPLVKMPFGLVWLMGGGRDWRFQSTPQQGLNGRRIAIPRGRMLGGSGSINSMVWFRGRRDDFDSWAQPGWGWADVEPAFEAVEARLTPMPLADPHPLTKGLGQVFPNTTPDPERESAGVFRYNLHDGRRWSAADGFLRPALATGGVTLRTGVQVSHLGFDGDRATRVVLTDGSELRASKGVVLAAGAIASPAILLRSGIGPAEDLRGLNIPLRVDAQGVGDNLHDHPSVGLHFAGPGSGYGLTFSQAPAWALAPLTYLLGRRGRLASPTVEGGMFFNAAGTHPDPDVQCHFIPFMLGWQGRRFTHGAGYFADVCLCRPLSRGRLRLTSADPLAAPDIDLGLLSDPRDVDLLAAGLRRLRDLLEQADFGPRRAPEAFPGAAVASDEDLRNHVRARCGTAYHPVGTVALGGPLTARLRVKGTQNLWVADASVMPAVTSANTNAPSMMIGWKGAEFIAEDAA